MKLAGATWWPDESPQAVIIKCHQLDDSNNKTYSLIVLEAGMSETGISRPGSDGSLGRAAHAPLQVAAATRPRLGWEKHRQLASFMCTRGSPRVPATVPTFPLFIRNRSD